jgi:hypothetical protein
MSGAAANPGSIPDRLKVFSFLDKSRTGSIEREIMKKLEKRGKKEESK